MRAERKTLYPNPFQGNAVLNNLTHVTGLICSSTKTQTETHTENYGSKETARGGRPAPPPLATTPLAITPTQTGRNKATGRGLRGPGLTASHVSQRAPLLRLAGRARSRSPAQSSAWGHPPKACGWKQWRRKRKNTQTSLEHTPEWGI